MVKINISYSLNDFMKYKDVNNYLPMNLKTICNEMGGTIIIRDFILKEVELVIDNFNSGKNPNDLIFKNCIIEFLNKVNQKNYDTIIDGLKKLNYTNPEHFATLCNDILLRAMTDTTAIKGIEMPNGQKSLSDLYAAIVNEFQNHSIKYKNVDVKFLTIFLDSCQKLFVDYMDPKKVLDNNNQYRVDSYKGFMNFLGILFSNRILSHKIVLTCINKVKDLMMTQQWIGWGQTECENIYDGYKKLLLHIVNLYQNKKDSNESDKEYVKSVLDVHINIRDINDKLNKLRKFTMMAHKDIEIKLNKLVL
jgi:hypothetical protein